VITKFDNVPEICNAHVFGAPSPLEKRLSKLHEAIKSAIASTQVVNEYIVKRTAKVDESIRYVASMTRLLKETYEKKPLHVIPTAVLTPKSHLPLLKDLHSRPDHQGRNYNITFPSFATLASKAGTLTLRDVCTSQIRKRHIQIRGQHLR